MPSENRDVDSEKELSNIYNTLLAIRRSIEERIRRSRGSEKYIQSLKDAILKVEGHRIDITFARRHRENLSIEIFESLRVGLIQIKDEFERDGFLDDRLFNRGPQLPLIPELHDGRVRIIDGIDILIDRLDKIVTYRRGDKNNNESPGYATTIAALRNTLPEQKLAPVSFDIKDSRIVVVRHAVNPSGADINNVKNARNALLEQGTGIIEALEKSNCDRRIIDGIKRLQNGLSRYDNIIELGIINISVDKVCKGAASEFPDALLGAIDGHIAGVGMYVAQFEEWRRFSENALDIELDASDIKHIGDATQAIIERVTMHPEIADEEIPKTLLMLSGLIANPGQSSRKAAFATLRTVENLVARVYQHGLDFLEQTTTKTVDGLSSAASKVVVGALLAVALAATASLGAVPSKVAEAAWMKTAAEIVQKQIEALSK
ncbi:hypothetical protein FM996_17415 [Methylosinus sporium]|uniref:Uncharacterized protein n=1 Tax=Methylosinus sporium TaxID=428 RepID=A0A549SL47_METSR|nr:MULTISPECIES: hypothetical protein [Methylosinus]MBU3890528.1 hypothetical protein [Methylosinus sp. KRF6]TRL30350.1 hypothetical protein FM996_17415 [Methylosinus sporium]